MIICTFGQRNNSVSVPSHKSTRQLKPQMSSSYLYAAKHNSQDSFIRSDLLTHWHRLFHPPGVHISHVCRIMTNRRCTPSTGSVSPITYLPTLIKRISLACRVPQTTEQLMAAKTTLPPLLPYDEYLLSLNYSLWRSEICVVEISLKSKNFMRL